MKIGELSQRTGVSIPTIRLYEREGLIGPAGRTAGQSRLFSEGHLARLDFIKRLRTLGLSMEEVRLLLSSQSNSLDAERKAQLEKLQRGVAARMIDLGHLREGISKVLSGELLAGEIPGAFIKR